MSITDDSNAEKNRTVPINLCVNEKVDQDVVVRETL